MIGGMETEGSAAEAVESGEMKWRALIQEPNASTQPIKVFCIALGAAASSFFVWRRKLSGQGKLKTSWLFGNM